MNKAVLDPWVEGHLEYLEKIAKRNHKTITDIRCTLKRTILYMREKYPTKNLWEIDFKSFLK